MTMKLFALAAIAAGAALPAPALAGTVSLNPSTNTLTWDARGASERTDGGIVYGAGQTTATTNYQVGDKAGTTAGANCTARYFMTQYIDCGPGSTVARISVLLGPEPDRLDFMPGTALTTGYPNPFAAFGSPPKDPPASLQSTYIDLGDGTDGGQGSSVADTVVMGPGEDGFSGGRGNDVYIQGDLPGHHDPRDPTAPTSGADAMDPDDWSHIDNDTVSYAGRTEAVIVTTGDMLPNDGETTEGDMANVESAIGGSAGDTLTGDAQSANHFAGGDGNDTINVRDATTSDSANCGADDDVAVADALSETAADCEAVDLPGAPVVTVTEDLRFSASEPGSTFECKLDDDAFGPCQSPFDTRDVRPGRHTLIVQATDAFAGDSDPDTGAPVSRSFTIADDTTAPDAPLITGSNPRSPAADRYPEILGIAEPNATVSIYATADCGGLPLATGSAELFADPGITVHVAPDTTVWLRATATDVAGNVSACSAAYRYVQMESPDTTAPDTIIVDGPAAGTTTGSATTHFTYAGVPAEDTDGFECKLDDAAFSPCSDAGVTYSHLSDGVHTFAVRSRDLASNVDASPAVRTWTVDLTPPDAPSILGTTPGSPANDNTPDVLGSAEPGATVKLFVTSDCSGDPIASGTATDFADSGLSVTVGDDTTTDLRATATDAAGNLSACSPPFTYVEDSTGTHAVIDSGPADGSTTPATDATFTYHDTERLGAFECSLDGAAFSPCPASGISYSDLGAGTHTFAVRATATDAAGNPADTVAATRSWTVQDTTPPETTITDVTVDRSTADVAFTSEPGAAFACKLDGPTSAAWTPCTSPKTYSNLAKGGYTVAVRASDAAGNTDPTPATQTFTIRKGAKT